MSVTSNFVNTPPTIKKPFTETKGEAPGSVTNLTLSEYFRETDAGQTLSYTSNSPSSQVNVQIINGELRVSFLAGATGSYTIPVTAKDNSNAEVSQNLVVVVYERPSCTNIGESWDPQTPFVLDLETLCTGSETRTYTELPIPSAVLPEVSGVVAGSTLTVTSTQACVKGRYVTRIEVTDESGATTTISVNLDVGPASENKVRASKPLWVYEVVSTPGASESPNDGELIPNGPTLKFTIGPEIVAQCASEGPLIYTVVSQEYEYHQAFGSPGTLIASLVGNEVRVTGANLGTMARTWSFDLVVQVEDQHSRQIVTVEFKLHKKRNF
jgi:hypothetical protein